MCIIIDTNTLASVFDQTSANHANFKPVFDWITSGKGKVVFGGTRYLNEIKKYAGIFNELKKKKKAIKVNDNDVDSMEVEVSRKIVHADFDDQHLVALLIISRSKLICSLDERAYKYFKHEKFFNRANKRPKIFRGSQKNRTLLIDSNIADICKPCQKIN